MPTHPTVQERASAEVRIYAPGRRGSPQRMWRCVIACLVQEAFGKNGHRRGLPRDVEALRVMALDLLRRSLDAPDFIPAIA